VKTSIVVARSLNGVIGNGSEIPWKVKGEQSLFKRITMGGTLVMGRKTFESIGRPLPGRTTIIISRNEHYRQDDCEVCPSIEAALQLGNEIEKPIFVAGGGEIYRLALPIVDTVHISTIQTKVTGDIYFPDFPTRDFELAEEREYESNINYVYQRYEKSAK
tara:strand:- start:2587 stop:3069 length:483 start_codon:yes stop_codon:yes gene_type:complete